MKDAYGGTLIIYLLLIFFLIYFSVIGIALNFAKLYRIKNNVINILEQNQFSGGNDAIVHDKLDHYLYQAHYDRTLGGNITLDSSCNSSFTDLGICIVRKGDNSTSQFYYLVTVYYYISMPILNITLPVTASGETVVIN